MIAIIVVVHSLTCVFTLCNPMDYSLPSSPVPHCLLEFAQIHVHRVTDAIQPSHPVTPFSSCPQSFSASGSFPMSRLFTSGGQSTGTSALAIFPMNIQGWFPLGLTCLSSLWSKGLSRVFSSTTIQKHQFFGTQPSSSFFFFMDQLSHPFMTTGKTMTLMIQTSVGKVTSLLFNMLSKFVIAFLPRSKSLVISWLWSPSAVILEPKKIRSIPASTFSQPICFEVMGLEAIIFVFLINDSHGWT